MKSITISAFFPQASVSKWRHVRQNQGREALTTSMIFLNASARMAKSKKKPVENPNKLPYGPDDIQAIEKRLNDIQQELREIRLDLKEGVLKQVELKLGTFRFFLTKMEGMSKRFRGEYDAQEKEARERRPQRAVDLADKYLRDQ